MKKGLFIFSIILAGFLMSGCTTKNKLYCTKVETSDTETTMQDLTVHFKDEAVKDMTLDIRKKLLHPEDKKLEEMYQSLLKTVDGYKDKEGYTITSKKSGDMVRVSLKVEPSKIILEDEKSILDLSATKKSLTEVYEEQGFTCE